MPPCKLKSVSREVSWKRRPYSASLRKVKELGIENFFNWELAGKLGEEAMILHWTAATQSGFLQILSRAFSRKR